MAKCQAPERQVHLELPSPQCEESLLSGCFLRLPLRVSLQLQ